MRHTHRLMLALWSVMLSNLPVSAAADNIVLQVRDSAAVYQDEFFKKPIFTAFSEDRLVVIKGGRDCYLVRNREGLKGWIGKKDCVQLPSAKQINFDSLIIQIRWDDLQSFIWVGGTPVQDDGRIFIERSFQGELLSNIDRDEMERKAR
jgi:hypothetical protein